jgi:hypothetical protein
MGDVRITTQGIRGGKAAQKDVGMVNVFLRHPQDRIVVDDYMGMGNDYKKRELSEIKIYQNGELLFSGNKYELFTILKEQK